MAAIINEYELSIWKDVWALPTLLDDKGNVTNTLEGEQVLDEEKSAILSTDNFNFPGKAININFKTKINGTHELTFDLPGKYIDPTTGKKTKNYLKELTDNETKIKLHYKDKWYTFYVKKITEKREKNITTFNYTCEDSYISELSKTGYKITFNEYTEHYVEQIHEFANDILDGSEWDYDETLTKANCDLIEYQEEKLIPYRFSGTLHRIVGSENHYLYETDPYDTVTLNNVIVYGFYSEEETGVRDRYGYGAGTSGAFIKQVIYVPDQKYEYSGNTICNKNCNYFALVSNLTKITEWSDNINYLRYGLKVVYNPYTVYNKALDRYVKVYANTSLTNYCYSFTKTRVLVPEIATNYAANGKDMIDTTGWAPENAVDKLTVDKLENSNWIESTDGIPYLALSPNSNTKIPNLYGIVASGLTATGRYARIINTGPYSRKLTIDTPTTFAVRLKYRWTQPKETTFITTDTNSEMLLSTNRALAGYTPTPIVHILQPIVTGVSDAYYKEIVTESSAKDSDGNYSFGSPLASINITNNGAYYVFKFTNEMLSNGPITDLFIAIDFDADTNKQLDFCVEELEFFEAWTHRGTHTECSGLVQEIPDDDVVPSWCSWDKTSREPNYGPYNWMKQYLEGNRDADTGFSASSAYDKMMSGLNEWLDGTGTYANNPHKDKNTLITCNSIVTGKTFDEEIYFVNPETQPQFADPYVIFIDQSTALTGRIQLYNNYKYRTLKQEKSNRFNLTQQLSELFHVYPVYEIEYYPNGKVKKRLYDENNNEITSANDNPIVSYFKRNKFLYYTDQKGGENKYGFKYGHNLNSISRTIDSSNVVSKMFVTDNLTQYAKDGICTISRAKDNLGKDNYLLRFDYFINRNLITREKVDRDLYEGGTPKRIYTWENDFLNAPNDDPYKKTLRNCEGYNFGEVKVYNGFLKTIGEINTRYDKLAEDQAILEKHQLVVLEASVQTYTSAVNSLKEQLSKQKNLTAAYAQESVNKKQAEYAESCVRIESKLRTYEIMLMAAQALYTTYADLYNRYECEMQFLLWCKKKVENDFNTRYESLLKEGVWQDSKYLEDNSYFLDAEKVLVDSNGPKITYTISVTDLSSLQKYQFTDFNVGDVTYVEDYEFFEDDLDSNDKFYQERTIVSAINCNLDNPSKNTISLQNYSTKFDDLFSRITASVQSLTFNENIYQRAANFTPSGRIDENAIQNTLDDNDLTLVGNQDVTIDGNGILVTDLRIPSNKVKIVGSGIFLTADGGNSWYGAFENGGINASLLTVGAINTKSISIFNEGYSNFIWDKDGITAYGTCTAKGIDRNSENSGIVAHTYVRFNQYGLFFVNGNTNFEKGLTEAYQKGGNSLSPQISQFIMENADVAITYDGFAINGGKRHVTFSSGAGIVMKDDVGDKKVQLGYIEENLPEDIKPFWGLYAQGAYIEGRLYSEKVSLRKVGGQSTGQMTVYDRHRSMLYGGKLHILRTIAEKVDNTDNTVNGLKSITTFGSSLMYSTEERDATKDDDTPKIDLDNLGSSIHLEKEGKFWSLAVANEGEEKTYSPKLLYVKEGFGSYQSNTFYVKCNFSNNSGSSTSSDRNLKKDIAPLSQKYIDMFDLLKPQTYRLKEEKENAPLHIGLIAQDVVAARDKVGLTEQDLGAVKNIMKDTLGISYQEILTIAIAKIKQLEERIKVLENKKPEG